MTDPRINASWLKTCNFWIIVERVETPKVSALPPDACIEARSVPWKKNFKVPSTEFPRPLSPPPASHQTWAVMLGRTALLQPPGGALPRLQPSTRHSATAAGTRRWGPEGAPWKGRCMAWSTAVAGSVLPLGLQLVRDAQQEALPTSPHPPRPLSLLSSPPLSSKFPFSFNLLRCRIRGHQIDAVYFLFFHLRDSLGGYY